jgi:ubiquinone biosynthesis protein COQ9
MYLTRSLRRVLLNPCRANLAASGQHPGFAASIAATQCKRTYFSIHHPDPSPFPDVHNRILAAAISRVPEYGFTPKALLSGAKDAGYLDVTIQLFPSGVFDLIKYHLITRRLALKDNVQFPDSGRLGLGAKVKTLAMARLRSNADIIHHWQGVR